MAVNLALARERRCCQFYGAGLATYQQTVRMREQKLDVRLPINTSLLALGGADSAEPHVGFHSGMQASLMCSF